MEELEKIIGFIVVLLMMVVPFLIRALGQRGRQQAPPPPQPRPAPQPQPHGEGTDDIFEELRKRIETAAEKRRREAEGEAAEPADEAEEPEEEPEYPRPIPQPPPAPQRAPQHVPSYRRPVPPPRPQPLPRMPRPMPAPGHAPAPAERRAEAVVAVVEQRLQAAAEEPPRQEMVTLQPQVQAQEQVRGGIRSEAWQRIEKLPSLRRAILLSEVLGSPSGLTPPRA